VPARGAQLGVPGREQRAVARRADPGQVAAVQGGVAGDRLLGPGEQHDAVGLAQAERRPVVRLAGDEQHAVVLALGALEQGSPVGPACSGVALRPGGVETRHPLALAERADEVGDDAPVRPPDERDDAVGLAGRRRGRR
jgi:hypothetical protein